MSRLLPYVLGTLMTATAAVALSVHSSAAVAANRCTSFMIDGASERIRNYDRHPPADKPSALNARYGAIADVISTLAEEHGILDSVCTNDAQKAPLFAEIAATSAWAIALESDIAQRLNASCPSAAKAFPTIMLADAWLLLANVVNENGGTVPGAFKDVIPKVENRAAAAGLVVPAWAETSQYWRDQIDAKEKPIIQACPSPSPTHSP